jgi:hypothetical protein
MDLHPAALIRIWYSSAMVYKMGGATLVATTVRKNIKSKISDYSTYGNILLALSVFFFLSVIIPGSEKSKLQLAVMMGTTISFLAMTFIFYRKAFQLKKETSDFK